MKLFRTAVLSAAIWLSSCGFALAQPVEEAKRACYAETFTFMQRVMYAKNVLGWSEAEVLGAIEAAELVLNDVQAFIRAVFRGQPDVAQQAVKRVYDTCVALRSSNAVRT